MLRKTKGIRIRLLRLKSLRKSARLKITTAVIAKTVIDQVWTAPRAKGRNINSEISKASASLIDI